MIKLNINLNTFNSRNSITGQIWFDLNNQTFPDSNWLDFPIIIIGWWLEELQSLVSCQENMADCRFMDGPYYFQVMVKNDSLWNVKFIRSGTKEDFCEFQEDFKPLEIIEEILIGAKKSLDFCSKSGWESDDIKILENLVNEYQSLQKLKL